MNNKELESIKYQLFAILAGLSLPQASFAEDATQAGGLIQQEMPPTYDM